MSFVGAQSFTDNLRWVESQLAAARDFVEETDPDALVALVVGGLSLLAAFGGFLLVSDLTAVPFVLFVAATGYGWVYHQELTARGISLAMTIVSILVLGLILVFIFIEAWPVFQYASGTVFGVTVPGLRLFTAFEWSPVSGEVYSLVPMIHGTVMVTLVATAVAGPLGVAAALFISEIAPKTVRELVKPDRADFRPRTVLVRVVLCCPAVI